jgi:molybdopterin-guanine dinucleotide biosynthesis protein A
MPISQSAALILAGGAARRLGGTVKPLLLAEGHTILSRQLRILTPLFSAIAISANDAAPFSGTGLPILPDPVADAGPLAGIAAGLAWSPEPFMFVVAGDMPYLEPAAIELLASHLPGVDAVAPYDGERAEPLHAFYSRSLAPIVDARLAAGRLAVHELLAATELNVARVQVSELAAALPPAAAERFLTSWNRPEDMD